jgi:hypothetical protein
MLSKKRRGDLPEDASNGSGEATEHDDVDESNWRQQFAVMQAQRDEARAELTAARLEIERARAAALAPCSRCRFHPKWTVRVRTMAGQVHTIECPDGPTTLVFHVKQKLAQFDHKWFIHEQLALVLLCKASSSAGTISNSSADSGATDSALVNDRTLASYGVSSGDLLELLVVDMDWTEQSLAMIERIKHGGAKMHFENPFHRPVREPDVGLLALSWALVNAVRYAQPFSFVGRALNGMYLLSVLFRILG